MVREHSARHGRDRHPRCRCQGGPRGSPDHCGGGLRPCRHLEGEPIDGILINRSPSSADALAWQKSSDYQAAVTHRQVAADYRVLIVEGVDEPADN